MYQAWSVFDSNDKIRLYTILESFIHVCDTIEKPNKFLTIKSVCVKIGNILS